MSCTTPGDVHDGAANPVLDVFGTARRHGRVVQPQARLVHQEHEQQPVIDMQETANQSMSSSGGPFRNSKASGRDPFNRHQQSHTTSHHVFLHTCISTSFRSFRRKDARQTKEIRDRI